MASLVENGVRWVDASQSRLVFKKRLYMGGAMAKSLEQDPVGIVLMYHQVSANLFGGRAYVVTYTWGSLLLCILHTGCG